jgi:hypothetical protein
MDIYALKRWHWTAIGLAAGLVIALGRTAASEPDRVGGEGYIDQTTFERSLRLPSVLGKPRVKDIVVYPAGDQVQIVSLRQLVQTRSADGWGYEDVLFAAPKPYQPLGGSRGAARPDVGQYLGELAGSNPAVTGFRYAWWREPAANLTLWALGGAALVGGVWPTLLRFLVGAGLGPKRLEPAYDLGRFHGGPEPAEAPAGPTEQESAHLRELEEAMLRGLAAQSAGADQPRAADAPATPSCVPVLQPVSEAAAAPVGAEAEAKEYQGEFYPVAKPGHGPPRQAHSARPVGAPDAGGVSPCP